jgi:hypothetical protein
MPDHLAAFGVDRVGGLVVVALHDEPGGCITTDDPVQHDQMPIQVTVISDYLPDVVRAGPGDNYQVAGVVQRLHADPVCDHITDLSGDDRTRA